MTVAGRRGTIRRGRGRTAVRLGPMPCALCLAALVCAGCASTPKATSRSGAPVETVAEQVDAAKKVMGAMGGGRELSPEDMKRVVKDLRTNPESQSAVQKILGTAGKPVVKYSPVTGKHYSGDLEYDPETGAKLEVIEE